MSILSSIFSTSKDRQPRSLPYGLFVFFSAIAFLALMGTVVLGYQSLRAVMIDSGVYSHLCTKTAKPDSPLEHLVSNLESALGEIQNSRFFYPNSFSSSMMVPNGESNNEPCKAQTLRLDLMFILATAALNIGNAVVGVFADIMGPKIYALLSSVLVLTGALLFAFSDPLKFDAYIPAFVIIAVGGLLLVMASMTFSNYFPKRWQPICSMALMACQDTGSLMFWILQVLYNSNKQLFTIRNFFLGYSAIPLLFLIVGSFYPMLPVAPYEEADKSKEEKQGLLAETPNSNSSVNQAQEVSRWQRMKNSAVLTLQQILSIKYFALLVWGSVGLTATYFFMTTLHDQALYISGGDKAFADQASFVFNIMMFGVGLISIIFTGPIITKFGLAGGIATIGILLTTTYGLALVPVKGFNYAAYVTMIVGRASLFGCWLQYILSNFSHNIGTLIGISTFCAGMVNLSNYLWTWIAVVKLNNNFLIVHICMGSAVLLTSIFMVIITARDAIIQRQKQKALEDAVGARAEEESEEAPNFYQE